MCERNEPFPDYPGGSAWRLQQVQVEWAQLPPGPLLQRFGHFMRTVGHMLEDLGHLGKKSTTTPGRRGNLTIQDRRGKPMRSAICKHRGRPTKFMARGSEGKSAPERTALPENTPLPDEEPDQEHGDATGALTSSSVATREALPVLASTTNTTLQPREVGGTNPINTTSTRRAGIQPHHYNGGNALAGLARRRPF